MKVACILLSTLAVTLAVSGTSIADRSTSQKLVRCYYRNDARDLGFVEKCNRLLSADVQSLDVTNRYRNSRRSGAELPTTDGKDVYTPPPPRPNRIICSVTALDTCRHKFDNQYANTLQFTPNLASGTATIQSGCDLNDGFPVQRFDQVVSIGTDFCADEYGPVRYFVV